MSGVRICFYRSLRTPMDTYLRTKSIWPYTSGRKVSRFSCYCLRASSGTISDKHKEVDRPLWHMGGRTDRMLPLSSRVLPLYMSAKPYCRAYSSHTGGNQDGLQSATSTIALAESSSSKATNSGNEWLDILNNAKKSAVDVVISAGKKAKEVSDEVVPHVQQLYDSHPYLEKVIVPVGGTLSATILAWFVMPRILRKLHKYAMQSPFSLVSRVPYEKSMWSSLEDPARYLITFMAFSKLGVMIAPSTSQYLPQAWRGAVVLSFVWFLHRWKTNFLTSAMANQVMIGLDRDTLITLEKMSSVGLLILGAMALAEACGVPVQSLLTIGGIGGVATAFASKDILVNLFSGLSLQFSKPFSVGDTIKAGSVEGQVVEMGLTTTSLLTPERSPVIVPNSLFASQVIENKSRARWRAVVTKILARVDDLDKIPLISEEIKAMLRSNPKVFIEKDAPYCYLSHIETSFAELTLGCDLISMKREEFLATKQEILLQAARIVIKHGAELGSSP